jgi:hypothetical protein
MITDNNFKNKTNKIINDKTVSQRTYRISIVRKGQDIQNITKK